jgi:hypothetical protein
MLFKLIILGCLYISAFFSPMITSFTLITSLLINTIIKYKIEKKQ